MEPRQQLALMDKIIRELDDLKNSQTALLKKIAHVEAENINLGSELLNDALPGVNEEIDDGIKKVTELVEKFKEYRNEYDKDHPAPSEESK